MEVGRAGVDLVNGKNHFQKNIDGRDGVESDICRKRR